MDVDSRQAALLTSYVDRAREGDAEAFTILAQRYYPVAMRLARRRTACVEDAEECCQEAMLSAWRSIGRFEGDSEAFVAWLVRIVDNRCADHWRRKNCRPRSVPFEWRRGEDTVAWVPVDRAPSPERRAERAEVRRNVDRLINEVPEPYASTLRMHHEGSSYVEIASSLEVPVGTVRSRLNRARAHMRGLVAASPELQVACTPRHWQWPRWRVPMLP